MARLIVLIILLSLVGQAQPRHLYLTWQGEDTSREMTVVFHTLGKVHQPEVRFGLEPQQLERAKVQSYQWFQTERRIHMARLTGLTPGRTYYFQAGSVSGGFSPVAKFRTVPDQGKIRMVTGGDMYFQPDTVKLLRQAALTSPDVVAIGGDIAYADGLPQRMNFWDRWLDNWEETMVSPEGYTLPMLLAIGNHDVRGGFGGRKDQAPFYFGLFRQDSTSYFRRRLGEYTTMFVLDTGHVAPQGGAQRAWLKKALEECDSGWKMALYHVPCYPSHRPFRNLHSDRSRKEWTPLFDQFQLTAAFENHDHTLKRTYPIVNDQVAQQGTVYFGDGCWGRPPRSVQSTRRWYEAKASSQAHVWVVDIDRDRIDYRAIGLEGQTLDQYRSLKSTDKPGQL